MPELIYLPVIKESLLCLAEYVESEEIIIGDTSKTSVKKVKTIVEDGFPAIVLIDPQHFTHYLEYLSEITSIIVHIETGALALCFALDPKAIEFLDALGKESNQTLFRSFLCLEDT